MPPSATEAPPLTVTEKLDGVVGLDGPAGAPLDDDPQPQQTDATIKSPTARKDLFILIREAFYALTHARHDRPSGMTRREILAALGAMWVVATARPRTQAVDPDFLRMWNAGVRRRPSRVSSAGRIAPIGEPGVPLTIRGRLLDKDGRTPVAGALVQAYQTDVSGHYLRDGDETWRLQGWARAGADGRFRFATIHPGPYPNRSTAAHVHFHAEGAGIKRQSLETIYFEGDPLLTAADRAASRRLAPFCTIWPVERRDGREECDILFRVTEGFVF